MLVAGNIQGTVGQTVDMKIVLDNVTTGLSGFQLTIQVDNPSVAIIESIVFPSYDPIPSLGFTKTDPSPPTASTEVTAVDLLQAIEPESPSPTGYVLFTLQIRLLLSGSQTSVTVSSVGKLNDDSGADIVAQRIPGSVIVN